MNFAEYTRITTRLSAGELADLEAIEKQAQVSISSPAILDEYVTEILSLFYQSFNVDQIIFIEQIFFENQLMIRRTNANQEFIFDWFEQTKSLPEGEKKQIQMVHVYRAMVSDIFEPYLSILVACIHLIEGSFDTFLQANLGAAEFKKHEFIKKRFKDTNLLKGYFPIIRNAISHAGSHGIRYEEGNVLFRKVKRGVNPTVDEVLSVSNEELIGHIQSLIDFTQCVDVSMNIFGIDANDLIIRDPQLSQAFFDKMFKPESYAKYREIRSEEYQKIWTDQKIKTIEKHEHFAKLFTEVCQKYDMPATTLRFLEKKKLVLINIPGKVIDLSDHQSVIRRISELIRYCLLVYQYFHFQFDSFVCEEEELQNHDALQVWIKKDELKLFNEGQSSYLDLIHDGHIFKNKIDWPITVDFAALREMDRKSIKEIKKRKVR